MEVFFSHASKSGLLSEASAIRPVVLAVAEPGARRGRDTYAGSLVKLVVRANVFCAGTEENAAGHNRDGRGNLVDGSS